MLIFFVLYHAKMDTKSVCVCFFFSPGDRGDPGPPGPSPTPLPLHHNKGEQGSPGPTGLPGFPGPRGTETNP